jgi:hypothetical protein
MVGKIGIHRQEKAPQEINPEEIASDYEAVDSTEEEWSDNGKTDEPKPAYTPEEVEQMSANEHGLLCGAHAGGYVMKNFLLPRPGKPHRGH